MTCITRQKEKKKVKRKESASTGRNDNKLERGPAKLNKKNIIIDEHLTDWRC